MVNVLAQCATPSEAGESGERRAEDASPGAALLEPECTRTPWRMNDFTGPVNAWEDDDDDDDNGFFDDDDDDDFDDEDDFDEDFFDDEDEDDLDEDYDEDDDED